MDRGVAMARVNLSIILLILMTFSCQFATAETLKDPTQPPNYRQKGVTGVGTKAAPKWVLSSTLISPARRLATINGKTLTVGERIGDARVLTIESARVSLLDGNKEIILELLPTDFKRMH
jgi:MSHA biogenesis protein MshK